MCTIHGTMLGARMVGTKRLGHQQLVWFPCKHQQESFDIYQTSQLFVTCTLQYWDDDGDDWNHPWRREVKDEEPQYEVEDGEEDQQHEDGEEDQQHEDGEEEPKDEVEDAEVEPPLPAPDHPPPAPTPPTHPPPGILALFIALLDHLDCFEACTVYPISNLY